MATIAEIEKSIGCLAVDFPKFVSKEIGRLADEFTSSVKAIPNPFASMGEITVGSLVGAVMALAKGDVTGDLGQATDGLLGGAAGGELQGIAPGVLPVPSGNKIGDVAAMGESVAGNAMMTLSLLPETPYVVAQRLCETLVKLVLLKLANLECLKKHILQLSNAVTVLIENRSEANTTLYEDLAKVSTQIELAVFEFGRSRRFVDGEPLFDVKSFERGRAALDAAMAALAPAIDGNHASLLGVTSVLMPGTPIPADINTPANARLAMMIVPHLTFMVRAEIAAIDAQNDAITYHVRAVVSVLSNYRSAGVSSQIRKLRLKTIATIIAKLTETKDRVDAAIERHETKKTMRDLVAWNVRLKALAALADSIRSEALTEGAAAVEDAIAFKSVYEDLVKAILAIDSEHVVDGVEDVTDLAQKCRGIAMQAESISGRVDDELAISLADLRTFQVLVAQTAAKMNGRIDESTSAGKKLAEACAPLMALSMASRPTIDRLASSMEQLGLDRGRDLFVTGAFGEFLGGDLNQMSYIGSAISCLSETMATVDDAVLKRRLGRVMDDLIGRKTNSLLTAADNLEFSGLRRALSIKSEIEVFQRNAETVKGILSHLQAVLASLGGGVVQLDPTRFGEMRSDVGHLEVGAGGRFAPFLDELSHSGAGVPLC